LNINFRVPQNRLEQIPLNRFIPTLPTTTKATVPIRSSNPVCGKSRDDVTSLVINGVATERGEYPWLVAYYNVIGGNFNFVCGGSLISEKTVVTGEIIDIQLYD
jgi:hypothetical protein